MKQNGIRIYDVRNQARNKIADRPTGRLVEMDDRTSPSGMTDDAEKKKALKAIRKAAREDRVVFAEQDRIGSFTNDQVAGFIGTIWGGKALVTDESQIFDFVSFGLDPADRAKAEQDCCTRIFEIYGVKCEPHEYLWQVLERIYK